MKKLLFLFAFVSIGTWLTAQDFEVPKRYKLEKAEDYKKYEPKVLECINWILNTPINEDKKKRQDANAFLMKWLEGSPSVTIEVNVEIVSFMDSSPDLLMIFFAGWTRHVLEGGEKDDMLAGNMAGLEAVMNFYEKNRKKMSKDKDVEKYIKMKEKGKLESFIEKKLG